MTFALTLAGRENLEMILGEFERASRTYQPLYHQRLIVWLEGGGVDLSNDQWQAFIDAESPRLDDSEWWQWDRPYTWTVGFSESSLGRWYGYPEGLDEFVNLAISVGEVLKRENFSNVDDLRIPFAFGGWDDWLSTLHTWAFRFQMPLLCCDQTLWGAEESGLDDFFELSEQFGQTGAVSWPLHPVCWSLTYNVFTSSASAIHAILRPETVIATNDHWPYSTVNSGMSHQEGRERVTYSKEQAPPSCHKLELTPMGWWSVQLVDSAHPILSRQQTGLHRIAILIEYSGLQLEPEWLAQFKTSRRDIRGPRTTLTRSDLDDSDGLTECKKLMSRQSPDDEKSRFAAGNELEKLLEVREAAIRNEDSKLLEITEDQIAVIKKFFHTTDDNKVKRNWDFRDPMVKQAYDAVKATIENSIMDLKRQSAGDLKALTALGELEDQIHFPELRFVPREQFTKWTVMRIV